jgi:flagellar biosynthesis anti-sigma factor FlgM
MKIDGNLPNPWLDALTRPKTEETKATAPAASNSVPDQGTKAQLPDDRVDVSSSPADTGRSEKVQALQQAIANGTYQVSSEDIADAILRDWKA